MGNANKGTRSVLLNGPSALKGFKLARLVGREQISRPFEYQLSLYGGEAGPDGAVDPESVLGQPLTAILTTASGSGTSTGERYFSGIITELTQVSDSLRFQEYHAVLRPALWLLTRRADCRVFQKMSTPDIVGKVFKQAGLSNYRFNLGTTYKPWEYRVQYRETDFDFVSRLLEHEGIYYYFEHSNGKHELVLVDDVGKLTTADGYDKVPFFPASSTHAVRDRDGLSEWSVQRSFQAAAFASREYNFEKPALNASAALPVPKRADSSTYEIFDYPAGASELTPTDVEDLAKLRAQQLQSAQVVSRASGDAAGLSAGRLFTLQNHPRKDFNKEYLVVAATLELTSDAAQTLATDPREAAQGPLQFRIAIESIKTDVPYRPERITPRPVIQGAQTALVCGPSGQEIWTDKYARVKVQFHWDRVGKLDDSSSCWIRVASSWAGKNWGVHQVPRVGQEVVVSFLEGDPDRPLVIGSVYNAEQMPPYALPTNGTRSGVMTRTSQSGTADNYNELRFEDKQGSEEIYLHAEKDLQVVVENNQTVSIGATKKDKGDRTVTIQNDDNLTVGNNGTTKISKDLTENIGNDFKLSTGNDLKVTVGNDLATSITGKETRTISGDRSTTALGSDKVDVTTKFELTAGEELTLSCGMAKISLKADGTVEISGSELKFEGTSKATLDAAQNTISGTQVSVTGTKTAVAGSATLDLSASGVATLKGSVTQIG